MPSFRVRGSPRESTDILQYAIAFTSILHEGRRLEGSFGLGIADADDREMDDGRGGRAK